MSHSGGEVRFKDGSVRYVEYNGTCDVMFPLSYVTREEMRENWREYPEEPKCEHKNIEKVELYSDYGNGFDWNGECCKDCGWITKGLDPHWEEEEDSEYAWWLRE